MRSRAFVQGRSFAITASSFNNRVSSSRIHLSSAVECLGWDEILGFSIGRCGLHCFTKKIDCGTGHGVCANPDKIVTLSSLHAPMISR